MKIALVCSEIIRESGHGRYMLELARRLAADHEVHVYTNLYQPVPGVVHHPVPAVIGINLFRVYSFWLASTWALRAGSYDIIHTIGGCTARRDVVTAQFCQRAWADELQKSGTGGPGSGLKARLRRLYHEIYWRACDLLEAPAFQTRPDRRLIAVSGGVRQELAHYYGADPDQVEVIYNGVEPDDFSPETLGPLRPGTREALKLPEGAPVLLFIGDFYRKGLGVAIAALAQLKTPNVHLLVVGRGEIEGFQAQADALGVGDRLRFVGFQSDVRPYFAAADAFVFPTRYEPFGMVITEAMAAGLPVVTTRAAGAAEVITQGVDGVLLDDPEDATGLATALDTVLGDPEKRRAMGEAARKAAVQVDWEYVVRETVTVYEALRSNGIDEHQVNSCNPRAHDH
jgi:glycosyltransferase involved in cell wall biosynthesis